MTAAKDGVHDRISSDPVTTELVDTPVFQRLRHTKQLSTVRLVYPSVNYIRFEHSLGTYHLAPRALSYLGVDGDHAAHVRVAALLHDIDHGSCGHRTEDLVRRRTGRDHDEIHHLLDGTAVGDVLTDHGLDLDRVTDMIDGAGGLGQLASRELDADRVDCLVRDAHHTGVPYGTISHGRLIRELRYRDGGLVLAERNVQTAEFLLLARVLMNATVHHHHVSRIAGAVLERVSECFVDDGVSIESFVRMADHNLLVILGECVPDLGRRIKRRDLYKRTVWAPIDAVLTDMVELDFEGTWVAEWDVADAADVPPESVIMDTPSRPRVKEPRPRVVVDGVVRRLEDASEPVGTLRSAERTQWRLGVYASEAIRDKVAAAVVNVPGPPVRVTTST